MRSQIHKESIIPQHGILGDFKSFRIIPSLSVIPLWLVRYKKLLVFDI